MLKSDIEENIKDIARIIGVVETGFVFLGLHLGMRLSQSRPEIASVYEDFFSDAPSTDDVLEVLTKEH